MNRLPPEPSTPLTRAEEKSLFDLHERRGRREQRLMLAEGTRVLEEAIRHDSFPKTLLIDAAGLDPRAQEVRVACETQGSDIRVIPSRQLAKLSAVDQPQGLIGIFPLPQHSLATIKKSVPRVLWCHALTDPGNFGTLCRSALAFGVQDLLCSGEGVDPFQPKVVRASAGAIFGLRVVIAEIHEILEWGSRQQAIVLALALEGKPWREVLPTIDTANTNVAKRGKKPLLITVGSEAHGLPSPILDAARHIVRIEQEATVESLNAAVAGSILLYETQT